MRHRRATISATRWLRRSPRAAPEVPRQTGHPPPIRAWSACERTRSRGPWARRHQTNRRHVLRSFRISHYPMGFKKFAGGPGQLRVKTRSMASMRTTRRFLRDVRAGVAAGARAQPAPAPAGSRHPHSGSARCATAATDSGRCGQPGCAATACPVPILVRTQRRWLRPMGAPLGGRDARHRSEQAQVPGTFGESRSVTSLEAADNFGEPEELRSAPVRKLSSDLRRLLTTPSVEPPLRWRVR